MVSATGSSLCLQQVLCWLHRHQVSEPLMSRCWGLYLLLLLDAATGPVGGCVLPIDL